MELNLELEEEISEYVQDPVEAQHLQDEELLQPARARGWPRQPELWPRVITISHDDLTHIRLYSVANDLLLAQGYRHEQNPGW